MTDPTLSPVLATQAVFCVCMDDYVAGAAQEAARGIEGCSFFGSFPDYITAERKPHFAPALRDAASRVALVDFDRDAILALRTIERLHQIFSRQIQVVGVGTDVRSELLLQAMRAGCAEYFPKPVDPVELASSLQRFKEKTTISSPNRSGKGRVKAFFGAKGGVGTTTLAVHLAATLASQYGKRTLLIDHKNQLGHVALYLGLQSPEYHFTELLRSVDRLDTELLNGFVIRHKTGLDVIPSPEIAAAHHTGKRQDLERVIDFLKREYDYILVDSTVSKEESKLALLEQADDIYLVSTPDVASLRDLARLVDDMSAGGHVSEKLRLVINRATADDSVSIQQIEKALSFPVALRFPNSYFEVMRAINNGEPVDTTGKSSFCQQLSMWSADVVKAVEASAPETASGRRKLRFWKRTK